jgi:hypothetical protein
LLSIWHLEHPALGWVSGANLFYVLTILPGNLTKCHEIWHGRSLGVKDGRYLNGILNIQHWDGFLEQSIFYVLTILPGNSTNCHETWHGRSLGVKDCPYLYGILNIQHWDKCLDQNIFYVLTTLPGNSTNCHETWHGRSLGVHWAEGPLVFRRNKLINPPVGAGNNLVKIMIVINNRLTHN